MVGQLGVAGRDMAGRTLVEAQSPEDAERGGEVLLTVTPLLFRALELGEDVRRTI